ncbi:DUF348 domain-containing protein [bacterium]|nr:DUF348 domain-containing protein [bacterium]
MNEVIIRNSERVRSVWRTINRLIGRRKHAFREGELEGQALTAGHSFTVSQISPHQHVYDRVKHTLTHLLKRTPHILDEAGVERGMAGIAATITIIALAFALTSQTRHSFRVFADEKRVVQLYVDGKRRAVVSSAATVKDILQENGVDLKAGDIVEPGAETVVDQPNYNINVYRALPAVVEDGGRMIQIVTGYRSARKIAAAAGVTLYPEDKAELSQVQDFKDSRSLGYKVTIDRALPVQLIVNGQVVNVRTNSKTVSDLLADKGIEYEPGDLQGIDPQAPIVRGMRIVLAKISQETLTTIEDVSPTTQVIYDANKDAGQVSVQREGVAGRKQVTYLIEKNNGVETKRTVLDSIVITAAIDRVEVRGSRPRSGMPTAEQWAQLRFCEAGGRYNTDTGNGYYGAYQMNLDFWKAYGGNPAIKPSQASPEEQDAVALRGYMKRGAQPWPVCGRFIR